MSEIAYFHQFIEKLDSMRHGGGATPAWRVYANTGLLACIDALQANYPSVHRLLGEAPFEQLAASYVRAMPARDARLFLYGAGLPAWIRRRDGADSAVALVATLDRYWSETHSEADALPLTMDWIAQQSAQALAGMRLRPAPSTRWLGRAGVALWDQWQALRQAPDYLGPRGQPNQAVLLSRPDDAVWAQALPLAGAVLLQACDDGLCLPQALLAAGASAPEIDLQQLLAMLFAAGALQHPDQFAPRAIT
ncbi:putative DNA-binding domain-containing protein [Massilia sp. DJPM01]|uniref:HvfC/BufC family peptide modification chaperone n=1 Tax=Massilia sp. DJPM01 TaxID=3024404 RepID=UPI00259F8834|nr:putative DNA-binding domain-containing protein [Massilia sp. DJPM01]MDM5179230.1 putative DNA-binding domain-containing protein [Massilia sp. DJPM01]